MQDLKLCKFSIITEVVTRPMELRPLNLTAHLSIEAFALYRKFYNWEIVQIR